MAHRGGRGSGFVANNSDVYEYDNPNRERNKFEEFS